MDNFDQLSQQILSTIKSSSNVLLHCHPSPDADSVGGVLAMREALIQLNKQVTIISGDSPQTPSFECLPGYGSIVEQTFLTQDLSPFDLFIIQDSSSLGQITKQGQVSFPSHLKTIVIDHHPSNQGFADINLVDSCSPSVCQILFNLFRTWEIDISPTMAINLYAGIYSDTGGFRYPGTTDQTLYIAADLANINPDFPQTLFQLENNQSPQMITYLGLALTQLQHFSDSRIVISIVSFQDLATHHLKPEQLQNNDVANLLKSVTGWQITASLIEVSQDVIKISLRTRDSHRYDLGRIACSLGGGGHAGAAGVTLNLPIAQALTALIQAIRDSYPQDFL